MTKLKIDRTTSLQNLLDKTKRKQYVDKDVLESAPKVEGDEIEFFKLGRYVSDEDLEKEYTKRGLVPADIYSIVSYDLENAEETDKMKYVGTHWKDKDGEWCFSTFDRWDGGERSVRVSRHDSGWDGRWWFAGLRASISSQNLEPQNSLDTQSLTLEERIEKLEEQIKQILK